MAAHSIHMALSSHQWLRTYRPLQLPLSLHFFFPFHFWQSKLNWYFLFPSEQAIKWNIASAWSITSVINAIFFITFNVWAKWKLSMHQWLTVSFSYQPANTGLSDHNDPSLQNATRCSCLRHQTPWRYRTSLHLLLCFLCQGFLILEVNLTSSWVRIAMKFFQDMNYEERKKKNPEDIQLLIHINTQ